MDVTREVELDASTEDVWAALTDPDELGRWFANDVELDAQPGGRAVFRWDNGEERSAVVVDVDPERRLGLHWDDGGTVVLELEEMGEGTRLLVTESSPEFSAAFGLQALVCLIA